jgi:hypothetical protein
MTDKTTDLELDENEEFEEAHDPKNAEDQSYKASAAAGDKTTRAKKRKGDKDAQDPSSQAYLAKKEDFSDDLNALISEEATLSEGFKDKAATIFEAVINSKLTEEVNRLEEEYDNALVENLEVYKESLVDEVDGYLNLVVENWMTENELAIEQGLRTEIAENFMAGLQTLFAESFIEVPESKIDIVDELADEVDELKEQVNTFTESLMSADEIISNYAKRDVILEKAEGLADTEVEKLFSLTENLDYEDDESFGVKVDTVKKTYFSSKSVQVSDDTDDLLESELNPEVGTRMASYVDSIRNATKI